MKLIISVSALPLTNGKFLPEFHFIEMQGASATFIPYHMGVEAACDSKEEALKNAKNYASRQAIKEYGENVEVLIKKED